MDCKNRQIEKCQKSLRTIECSLPIPREEGINFEIKELVDSGNYGKIFIASRKDGDDIFVKIIYSNNSEAEKEIKHEVCYQHRASQYNISPKIIDYWWCGDCRNNALIAMENAGNSSLEKYLLFLSEIIIKDITSLKNALQVYRVMLTLFHRTLIMNRTCGIIHNDMHLKNIMLTMNNRNHTFSSLKIIDFGKSEDLKDTEEILDELVCDKRKNVYKKFDSVMLMNKGLIVDVMMPLEFFSDMFIKRRQYKPSNPPKNIIFEWFYEDFIIDRHRDMYILSQGKQWIPKDVDDHIEDIIDGISGGLEDEDRLPSLSFLSEKDVGKIIKDLFKGIMKV